MSAHTVFENVEFTKAFPEHIKGAYATDTAMTQYNIRVLED